MEREKRAGGAGGWTDALLGRDAGAADDDALKGGRGVDAVARVVGGGRRRGHCRTRASAGKRREGVGVDAKQAHDVTRPRAVWVEGGAWKAADLIGRIASPATPPRKATTAGRETGLHGPKWKAGALLARQSSLLSRKCLHSRRIAALVGHKPRRESTVMDSVHGRQLHRHDS